MELAGYRPGAEGARADYRASRATEKVQAPQNRTMLIILSSMTATGS